MSLGTSMKKKLKGKWLQVSSQGRALQSQTFFVFWQRDHLSYFYNNNVYNVAINVKHISFEDEFEFFLDDIYLK